MTLPSSRRSAFTLVELLVVIAIIGVLVALLLPAVQAAREAANRMSCSNNLKQLGLAFHNYNDTYKKLPYASTYNAPATTLPRKHTWVEFILPFIEQQPLYDKMNFNLNNDDGTVVAGVSNLSLIQNRPFAFIACPSNGLNDQFFPNTKTGWAESTSTQGLDYPLVAGSIRPDQLTPDCAAENSFCISENAGNQSWGAAHSRKAPGPFNRGVTSAKLASITDGLSNTFFAGDRIAQECNWGGAFANNFPVAFAGQKPNSKTRTTNVDQYWINCGYSSFHPGGVMMLVGDGSVRFVPEQVDFATWCYLSDKADGNVAQMP